jgi:hypothetical protein
MDCETIKETPVKQLKTPANIRANNNKWKLANQDKVRKHKRDWCARQKLAKQELLQQLAQYKALVQQMNAVM